MGYKIKEVVDRYGDDAFSEMFNRMKKKGKELYLEEILTKLYLNYAEYMEIRNEMKECGDLYMANPAKYAIASVETSERELDHEMYKDLLEILSLSEDALKYVQMAQRLEDKEKIVKLFLIMESEKKWKKILAKLDSIVSYSTRSK